MPRIERKTSGEPQQPHGSSPPYVGLCVALSASVILLNTAQWMLFLTDPYNTGNQASRFAPLQEDLALILCLAAINVAVGFGIWMRRSWARRLVIGLLCLVSPPYLVLGLSQMGRDDVTLNVLPVGLGLLSLASIWYLCQPEARRWFNEEVQAKGREGLGLVAALVIVTILICGAIIYMLEGLRGLK